MAESLLVIVADRVLGKLGSLAYEEISSSLGVEADLKRLERTLSLIRGVLLDADKRQEESHELQVWILHLKQAFHNAEDVLGEIQCEALKRQVMRTYGSASSKVRRFFSPSNPVTFRIRMAHKIKEVMERLDEIAADRAKFLLVERVVDSSRVVMPARREMTHSFVLASEVVGRFDDREKMVLLLTCLLDGQSFSVIPVVGIGGLGKTTLAKMVFNDERVVEHFEMRIWVNVSEEFDLKLLMVKMIRAATGENHSDLDPDQLQNTLKQSFDGKKFLLVLDDVCNEDPVKWAELKGLLSGGSDGSKILVTTRSPVVASVMGTISAYNLRVLVDEESLTLLLKWALNEGDERQHRNLVEIGKDIVKKCGGIPLAVRTLGSLLYLKTDENDWKLVRDSELWGLEQKDNHILPALQLSYNQLPPHLKPCFAALSFFPKGYDFVSNELIQVWMAHGLLQSPDGNQAMDMEDIGRKYLKELFVRCFFQDFQDYVTFYIFTVHDLAHDLASLVSERECFFINDHTQSICHSARHLLFSKTDFAAQELLRLPCESENVRSIMFDAEDEWQTNTSILKACFSRFKYLRLLDLRYSSFDVLPSSIANLRHLRYLSLHRNFKVRKLPSSICNLQSLQTLRLSGCTKLEELPRDIKKMVSLRFLAVTTMQKSLPVNGIECLSSLRYLSISRCSNLGSLFHGKQNLTALKTLFLASCESLESLIPFVKDLTSLENLFIFDCKKLELKGGDNLDTGISLRAVMLKDLPQLESLPTWLKGSAKSLQSLHIGFCPNFTAFPEWIASMASLQRLEMIGCERLSCLPGGMVELKALKKVQIARCPMLADRCVYVTGVDWPLIAHVPEVEVDQFIRSENL